LKEAELRLGIDPTVPKFRPSSARSSGRSPHTSGDSEYCASAAAIDVYLLISRCALGPLSFKDDACDV
jgi:hypothetical protein